MSDIQEPQIREILPPVCHCPLCSLEREPRQNGHAYSRFNIHADGSISDGPYDD